MAKETKNSAFLTLAIADERGPEAWQSINQGFAKELTIRGAYRSERETHQS
jgi:hypothetical protein